MRRIESAIDWQAICGPVTCRRRLVHPSWSMCSRQLWPHSLSSPGFALPLFHPYVRKPLGFDASTCCYRFLLGGRPMHGPFDRLTIAHGFLPLSASYLLDADGLFRGVPHEASPRPSLMLGHPPRPPTATSV